MPMSDWTNDTLYSVDDKTAMEESGDYFFDSTNPYPYYPYYEYIFGSDSNRYGFGKDYNNGLFV